MKRFLNIRSLFSLALLWLAASALVLSLKTSILGLTGAAFLPVAIFAMLMAYVLGFGSWPARHAWIFLIAFNIPFIFLQASRTAPAVWQILTHLPLLEIKALFSFITGQPLDASFFQFQLDQILDHVVTFLKGLTLIGNEPHPILLEVLWDVPLFMVCAWSGWWSSRHNSILHALIPSLGVQVFLLNYSQRQEGLTLQIGMLAFLFLMGLHQNWSMLKSESKTQGRVRMQTYAMVFILSTMLVLAAGWAPRIPRPQKTPPPSQVQEQVQEQEQIAETIQENIIQQISGTPPGLPQNHQINAPPQNLMDVIFLANIGEGEVEIEPVAQNYYWRWITYDAYDGRGWNSSATTSASYSADQALFDFSGEGYRLVHQTIIKASAADDHLYWTGSLVAANQPMETTWRTPPPAENPLLHMDMLGSLAEAQQYSADSLLPQFSETQLRAASQVYPTEILQKYLSLPAGTISQRVRDLAVTLTYQAPTPYDKAKAIEAYLRTYPYSLDVPALPADKEISDYFLFELKTGYCEYYATSMLVLARTVGLPARMVIGYASNEYDTGSGQYIVRDANAHSWVEIYFPDIGWVEFEPTASEPIIEQGSEQQQEPPPLPEEDLSVPPTPVTPTIKDRSGIIYNKHGYFASRSPFFAILLSIIASMGICLLYLRIQGLWFSYKNIGAMYQYIYRHGRKVVPGMPLNATPSLFAEMLKTKLNLNHQFLLPAADELDQLTSLYLKETYTRHAVTPDEQEQAVKTWYRLFWRLLYARTIMRLPVSLRAAAKQSPH